jgi:hypothetical protein
VQWKGKTDFGFEEEKPVVPRFKLDQARVFGLQRE